MKRWTRNLVSAGLLILLLGLTAWTVYAVKQTAVPTPPTSFDGQRPNWSNGEAKPNTSFDESIAERPDGEMPQPPQDNGQSFDDRVPHNRWENANRRAGLAWWYILLFGAEGFAISAIVVYLILSGFHKKGFRETFYNGDKVVIGLLAVVIGTLVLGYGLVKVSGRLVAWTPSFMEEDDDEQEIELDKSNAVNTETIRLSEQTNNVTITKSGTFELTGSFGHSVIVDVPSGKVTLVLNNVSIEANDTAAIIGLSGTELTVVAKKGTTNILKDGGNTTYDGALYSRIPLVLDGEGKIVVNGTEGEGIATTDQPITIQNGDIDITSADDGINAGGDNGGTVTINGGIVYIDAGGDGIDSNKDAVINGGQLFVMGSYIGGDAGIDCDKGFSIHGGTVVALGTDMLQRPKQDSKQNTLAVTLGQSIVKDTLVAVLSDAGQELVSFKAKKPFKTLIISSPSLTTDTYQLYQGGQHSGTLTDGLYVGGQYTPGEVVREGQLQHADGN